MMRKILFCLALILLQTALLMACDMSALVFRQGRVFSDYANASSANDFNKFSQPADYLAYVMSRSDEYSNSDGYGILYYERNTPVLEDNRFWYKYVHSVSEHGYIWYTGNYFDANYLPDVFDEALESLNTPETRAAIVLCHARFASSYPFAPGNHPFRMDLNNRTYSLMHNGTLTTAARTFMVSEIIRLSPYWFEHHTPNFPDFANAGAPALWIDSELLFNYLMCHTAAAEFNLLNGLRLGLLKLKPYITASNSVVNFVISDGQRLYAYRSTPVSGAGSDHRLSYKYNASGFWGIRTGEPNPDETQVQQGELVIFSPDSPVESHPDFIGETAFANLRPVTVHQSVNHRVAGNAVSPDQMGIRVSFELARRAFVKVTVYNLKGQLVKRLNDSILPAGNYSFSWNGTNTLGQHTARGVYYIELIQGGKRHLNKVMYLP
jgi:hypothetical protein